MTLLIGACLAAVVAVLPLEGPVEEAGLATEGVRDALLVAGWEVLSDGDLHRQLGDEDRLDGARDHAAAGRRSLARGDATQALAEFGRALELHDSIGSAWLRRTEMADLYYLRAVASLRAGDDPSSDLYRAARLVEDYQPPAGYSLKVPDASMSLEPTNDDMEWLQERLQADALVLGELRRGRLTLFWIEGRERRRASASVEVAPYPGDPLYASLASELLGHESVGEEPAEVEFVTVERPPEPIHEPVVETELPPQPRPVEASRSVDRRWAWWAPVGVGLLGGAAGVVWAVNADLIGPGAKVEPPPARYTVVIESPR